jgi:protein-tyrosine phosphatase
MPGDLDIPPWDPSKVLQIAVDDMPFAEIFSHLDRAAKWIAKALNSSPDARVLVHCFQGISRSTTIVCAYLMFSRGWSVSHSLSHIKGLRYIAEPNPGFVSQLKEYEASLK